MPRLAVLLPVRNAESYIHAAVSSTLRALPRDSQLLLFDDASDDATFDIVARFRDSRIRVVSSTSNVGPGAALSRMLADSDSEFVARMDADDVCFPWRFALQLASLKLKRADFVFSPVVVAESGSARLRPTMPMRITARAMPLHLVLKNPLIHPTMTATRSAVEAAGGYRTVVSEDYDLWLRAATARLRIVRTGLPVLAYRRHAAQLSGTPAFDRQVVSDPVVRATYAALCDALLGEYAGWMPGDGTADESESARMRLRALVLDHSLSLPPDQRMLVRRATRLLGLPDAR